MSEQRGNGGSRPVPDPTYLTDLAIDRLREELKELFGEKMDGIRQSVLDQKELRNAQLGGIQEQLTLAERLRLELKADNEKNIDKALTGVEKANEKLETSITRTLSQMSATAQADTEGLRRDIDALKERINDNKERVVSVEQQRVGAKEDRTGLYAALGAVLLLLSIGGIIAGVLANVTPG